MAGYVWSGMEYVSYWYPVSRYGMVTEWGTTEWEHLERLLILIMMTIINVDPLTVN